MTGHRKLIFGRTIFLKKMACILLSFFIIGCAGTNSRTVNVVKPKSQKRHYDPKKDKKAKRTKTVKMRN